MAKLKIPVLSEHEEQVIFVTYCRNHKNSVVHDIFAIPNGGKRSLITAIKLKNEGVTAGVPDLFLPYPSNGYHGLFIELKKSKGGTVSSEQKIAIERLNKHGYKAVVCKGAQEAIAVVEAYIN